MRSVIITKKKFDKRKKKVLKKIGELKNINFSGNSAQIIQLLDLNEVFIDVLQSVKSFINAEFRIDRNKDTF